MSVSNDQMVFSANERSGIRELEANSKLRVAFVCDTMQGRVTSGGVVAAQNVVAKLRERHEVVVISADATDASDIRMPGFQFPLKAMRDQDFVMARPRRDILREVIASVDIVHVQFPFWLSKVAIDEAHRLGRPVVAAFHVQPENALHSVGVRWPWLNRATYRFWINHIYNRADAVICPSEFAKRKLREHGLRSRAVVISNGVPPDIRTPPAGSRDLPRQEFVIMSAGRLAAEKRQDLLIEAVRRSRHCQRIRVRIAGAGPREASLRRLAASLPNVIIMGHIPRATLLSELSNADMFVHCSDVELEGIAVLEAMSLGVPIVVSDSSESAASQFALDERFTFTAGDVTSLTEKMDALIDNPELLQRARSAVVQVARSLDFGESVERIVSLYTSVLLNRAALRAG